MTTTIRGFYFASAAIAALGCGPSAVLAASINHGDFDDVAGGGLVSFAEVTESSVSDPVPLYGAPVVSVDSLDFNPTSFTANATGGTADDTDGQLDHRLVAEPGTAFSAISVSESGNFTLEGDGTAATSVAAAIYLQVTIHEVDGAAIAPLVFPRSDSKNANLVNNPGVAQPLDLWAGIDLLAKLTDAGIDYALGVTRADVVLNNILFASSEQGTNAIVVKKDFIIDVTTEVPEPTTAVLAMLTLASLGLVAGRNSC